MRINNHSERTELNGTKAEVLAWKEKNILESQNTLEGNKRISWYGRKNSYADQWQCQLIFDKWAEISLWEKKDTLFNKWCWLGWISTRRSMKQDPLPSIFCKNQLKMDQGSESTTCYNQITRGNHWGNSTRHWHWKRLLGKPEAQAIQANIDKWELQQAQKLLYNVKRQ